MKRQNQPLSEFNLIQRLTKQHMYKDKDVVVGVGDDCAVLIKDATTYTLATCDIQVADVHFLSHSANPEDIGRKAMAVNLSDIAAMGGKPTYSLVSLILPTNIQDSFLEFVYKGLNELAKQYDVTLIGGNVSSGQQFAVDIFLLGEAKKTELVLRSGAKVGDKVLVTGSLGNAAAGLAVLQNAHIKLSQKEKAVAIKRQCSPSPRIAESSLLAASKKITSMIDISDGLTTDMLHLCEQSNVGVVLYEEKIPISTATKNVAKQLVENPLEMGLSGGEDYELLFTAPATATDTLIKTVKNLTSTQVTVIGEIIPQDEGVWLQQKNGLRKQLAPTGWDHRQK